MASLKSAPNAIPITRLLVQLRGRTKPSSCQGVSEPYAHASTSSALSGAKRKLPARIRAMAARPSGAKPRSAGGDTGAKGAGGGQIRKVHACGRAGDDAHQSR